MMFRAIAVAARIRAIITKMITLFLSSIK